MKKIALKIRGLMLAGMLFTSCSPAFASVWGELKDQVYDQTKVTITKSGGVAGFYDASVSEDKVRQGVLSHVLTNRFLAASLGWYTGNHKEGVLVGGPSVKINEVLTTFIPELASLGEAVPILKPLDVGFNYGWGTDDSQHYGFHIMWNFGKK